MEEMAGLGKGPDPRFMLAQPTLCAALIPGRTLLQWIAIPLQAVITRATEVGFEMAMRWNVKSKGPRAGVQASARRCKEAVFGRLSVSGVAAARRSVMALLAGAVGSAAISACTATAPANPSFPLTSSEAKAALREMKETRVRQQRPLVIVGGYGDPGFATSSIRDVLEPLFIEPTIVVVNLDGVNTFDGARAKLIKAIQKALPSDDPTTLTETDVIGNSMGGVVAWYATDAPAGTPAARIATLYTIASPFQGAEVAKTFPLNDLVRDSQPGSPFLTRLAEDRQGRGPRIIPYTRSDDTYVGASNTAPMGELPWWVPAQPFRSGHMTSFNDERILADIARRLRHEAPFTTEPRSPLPTDGESGPAP